MDVAEEMAEINSALIDCFREDNVVVCKSGVTRGYIELFVLSGMEPNALRYMTEGESAFMKFYLPSHMRECKGCSREYLFKIQLNMAEEMVAEGKTGHS